VISYDLSDGVAGEQVFSPDDLIQDDFFGIKKSYNSLGMLLSSEDKRGNIQSYVYEKGKIKEEYAYFPGMTQKRKYTYNKEASLLSKVEVGSYVESYSYDKYGRLKSIEGPYFELEYVYEDSYLVAILPIIKNILYSKAGRISQIEYSSGLVLRNDYNEWGKIEGRSYVYEGESLWKIDSKYNMDYRVSEQFITSDLNTYGEFFKYANGRPEPQIANLGKANTYKENAEREVTQVGKTKIGWENGRPVSLKTKKNTIKQFFSDSGELLRSCSEEKCISKLTDNTYDVLGNIVQQVSIKGIKVGVFINDVFYPVAVDHLGSLRGVFRPEGSSLFFERLFDLHGKKVVRLSRNNQPEAKEIEKMIPWSFAGLKQLPYKIDGEDLYFSKTRLYGAGIRRWLSIDRLIKQDPKGLLSLPGNWWSTVYVNGDPLNSIDPSGRASYQANRSIGTDQSTEWDGSKADYSHTFTFTTKRSKDGKEGVKNTYSWGNDSKSWFKNAPEDLRAAKEAFKTGEFKKIGDDSFDHVIEQSFQAIKGNKHGWRPWNNCKHATDRLNRRGQMYDAIISTLIDLDKLTR
jgi:hypothetical protein